MFIGFARTNSEQGNYLPFILYYCPIMLEWVSYGLNPYTFSLQIMNLIDADIIRQYHPYQLPLVVGFRKNIRFMLDKPFAYRGATTQIVRILRDSGYSILNQVAYDNITPEMLDNAMKERPDLFERREMKEV